MFLLRIYDGLIIGLAILAGVAIGLTTLAIIVDVSLRNLGMRPFQATSALVEYSLLFATMAAAPWLVRIGGHVAVNSFVERLPTRWYPWVMRAVMALAIAVLALLCWRGVLGVLDELRFGGTDMRSIDIPSWVAYALLAGGFGLMATEVFRLLLRGQLAMGGSQSH